MFEGSLPDDINPIDINGANLMVCIAFQEMHYTSSMACMDPSPFQSVLLSRLVFMQMDK
jgi:hypothetical protein